MKLIRVSLRLFANSRSPDRGMPTYVIAGAPFLGAKRDIIGNLLYCAPLLGLLASMRMHAETLKVRSLLLAHVIAAVADKGIGHSIAHDLGFDIDACGPA
jgi:hypothetical protein